MTTVRAQVKNGILVLDEPTGLRERTEVELEALADDLDDEDRGRLHAALDTADDEPRAGKGVRSDRLIR
jgi:hypothetical protein